jgi:hypothetical protein
MKYLTQKQYSAAKGRLTRAKKKGPEAVIAEVERTFLDWEGYAWPDDWRRWESAKEDAEFELRAGNNEWRVRQHLGGK